MKAFSYSTPKGEIRIGVEVNSDRFDFTHTWEIYKQIKSQGKGPEFMFLQIMLELGYFSLQTFEEVISTVRDFRPMDDLKLGEIKFEVPIGRPQKILCLGRNYKAHAEEWGSEVPEEPIFFAKMPSSMLPHEGEIILPKGIGKVEHEIELGVVIGKPGKAIPDAKAFEYVAGYTTINDVSARTMQLEDFKANRPWLRSKSFDTFCPIGPYLVPKELIPDPHNLELTLRVNGQVRQHSNTSLMVFKIPKIIAYISNHMTLLPGDIIATGTPEGTSPIEEGDIVEAEVENLGVLRNKVVASG